MVSSQLPPFDTRFADLSKKISEMADDVSHRFSKLPEQLAFRHVREKLDQLMIGVPPIQKHAVQDLSIQLERLAAQVQKATKSFLNEAYIEDKSSPPLPVGGPEFTMEAVHVPLCSSPRHPSQIFLPEGDVKKGMEKLDAVCDCIQIKGDGDCLFRAFATGLLCNFIGKGEQLIDLFKNIRTGIGRGIPQEVWKNAEPTVEALATCRSLEDVTIIMNDEKLSNSLTKLMRHLAVAAMQAKHNEDPEYLPSVIADRPEYAEDAEQYFEDMRNPPDVYRYGGQAEYLALGSVFGVPVTPLDVQLIGTNDRKKRMNPPTSLDPKAINLLFRVNHYDLAIPDDLSIPKKKSRGR